MHFKKLELIGFKSFFNKTILHFEPGVTAVVGPNGCGKSNIFDSIRWVLGEQSVKSMRGVVMEDVIFNGTDLKEPLGMAEVSLTFDNGNRFFPVEQDEVVITRRIFRSGESEYLLNKAQVRLKDILDLLMGTGIGAESYSLIPQGKIDLILSSKPEDRRLVFDEASGVTKYKAQKKEALRKLEETEQNLLRVNDIIIEVKRQIGSLERQANKARRYKELFDELKSIEIKSAYLQKKNLEIGRADTIASLNNLQAQSEKFAAAITQEEAGLIDIQAGLKNIEDSILKIKNDIMSLENSLSRDKAHINFNNERIKELESAKRQLAAQLEQSKNRLAVDEEKLKSIKEEYAFIKNDAQGKAVLLREKETQLNQVASNISQSVERTALLKKDILELAIKSSGIKNQLQDINSKQQIFLARRKRLEIEKTGVDQERIALEITLNDILKEIAVLEHDFKEMGFKTANVKDRLGAENGSLNGINSDIGNLEKEKLALESQKQFIEELKIKYEDISESMNAVIYLDKPPQERISGLLIKIKNCVLESSSTQEQISSAKFLGEAKSFDLDTQKINEKILHIEAQIQNLMRSKKEKQYAIEELEQMLCDLNKNLREQEITLSNRKTSYQSTREEFSKIEDEYNLIVFELSDVQKELNSTADGLSNSHFQLDELTKRQVDLENAISGEQNNISVNNSLKEETLIVTAKLKAELDALNKRIGSYDDTLKEFENRYRQDKDNLAGFEKQSAETENRLEFLKEEINGLNTKISSGLRIIDERKGDLEGMQDKYRESSAESEALNKKIEQGRKECDDLKNKLYELKMQNKDLDFRYLSLRNRLIEAYNIDIDVTPQELPGSNQCQTESVDLCSSVQGEDVHAEGIKALKEKLNSCGTVNLVAIEEYDELKKRYDFLTQQQTDLITAKDSLREAILKINRTTRKMFLEAFEKISVEFRSQFKLLFNGGDAQIYLVDEHDPLESGIEIICRPPGKKLQNVLLLSGGEKAMSAIALIFAIFKFKPAPFCVLDEIDAALDEANVDRFGKALQDFTKTSQFIVITHNKKTIANADIMYGITMEESGISKIVSVKFASNQNKPIQEKIFEPQAPVAEAV